MDFKKKIKLFDIAQNIYLRTIFLALNVGLKRFVDVP